MPFLRLLYVSHSRLEGDHAARLAQIGAIAESAKRHNAARDVTGLLVEVDDTFIQVLEGPPAEVETVFEAICCDLRHADVRLLDLTGADTRLFADWDMALLSDRQDRPATTVTGLQEIRFMLGINAEEAMRLMRELLTRGVPAQVPAAA